MDFVSFLGVHPPAGDGGRFEQLLGVAKGKEEKDSGIEFLHPI